MALNADTLLDRIHLKRLVTKWRILAIIAVVFAAVISLEKTSKLGPLERDFIARLTIDGVIMDDVKRDKLLSEIKDNDHIKAVIVRLDTPGGSAVGGEQTYKGLLAIAKKKPVVSVMRSMSTSAGYMVALATDQIFAMEGTITGSIGVLLQLAEATELADKIGIHPITVKSGPYKGSPSPFEKFTESQRQVVQQTIDDFYNVFVDMVAQRRNLPRDTVVKLADGRIYSGRQALDNKLIDAIGGEEEAVQWLAKNRKIDADLPIEDVKEEKEVSGILEELSGSIANNIFSNMLVKLDGLTLIWQPNAL